MDISTVLANNAYPTPFANNPILPLLLLSLAKQKHVPFTSTIFNDEYDYIIVGAGSAGSVVDSRLSEVPCVKVLLLEAGKSPPLLTDVPAISTSFWFSDVDWAFKTVPQKHAGFGLVNNQVVWPSGKGLGGSSMLNGMLYVRGNKKNFDDWARHGAVGWSYSDIRPYFLKCEDNRDPEYLANGYHAIDGPVSVHKPGYDPEVRKPILETAKILGYKILDSNGRRQTGYFVPQGTIRDGQRCSTAKAYLVPAENRTNLDIVTRAYVTKILIEGNKATGVQFDREGFTHTVRARREVIMSAGVVNTAQLLMLSGIGPKAHLEDLNIPVLADLHVGNNLQDHIRVPVQFQIDNKIPSLQKKFLNPKSVEEYFNNRTGIFSYLVVLMAFLNKQNPHSKIDSPDFVLHFDEISSKDAKDQFGLTPEVYQKAFRPYENSSMCVCFSQNLQPRSRGTVRLRSVDPYDMPLIDPNYFGDPRDMVNIVAGMKACVKIVSSAPMQKIKARVRFGVIPLCEKLKGDAYLECVARTIIATDHHPVGTAKMGDPGDSYTVVDPLLRVKYMENLRVVDASIMPIIPSANTNAATLMLAEKASDIIKSTINCYMQSPVTSQNEFTLSPYFQKLPVSPITVY